ncbi:MAG: VOC family protein [Pseudomonadales bacterium]|nr:VOC family protein [Pseudomonadales bacterium]
MQLNGIAHIQLTVNNFARCEPFYRQLLQFLEMDLVFDGDDILYGVGSRTGILVRGPSTEYQNETFQQQRIGLHHFCFRARSKQDIDQLHGFLKEINATIIHAPEDGPWAPNYYSVLFEDPDGIRIEANYVPGKGNLDPGVNLPLKDIGDNF